MNFHLLCLLNQSRMTTFIFAEAIDESGVSAVSALEPPHVEMANECNNINTGASTESGIDGIAESTIKPDAKVTVESAIQYDPFVRARNVPFRIANRHRSISVFESLTPLETIYEKPEAPQNEEN